MLMIKFIKKNKFLFLILVGAVAFFTFYFFSRQENLPLRTLPYFGKSKPKAGDTVYHTVPEFSFVDQNGITCTRQRMNNKITIVDYFFTTCGSICPVMKTQMKRVYQEFFQDSEIMFLSHTVDPETDSIAVLHEFANRLGIDYGKWFFVTGEKKQLYEMARKGYLLDAAEGSGDENDFIHTQNFALVDKEFHLRGFYDGTDSADINRLIREIRLLQQEYASRK
jgi:protein SCO1